MSVGYQNGNDTNRPSGAADQGSGDWNAVRDDLTGAAGDLAGAATARGRQFVDAARDQAADYVDRRKESAAQSVADAATSLRESGSAFEDRPNIKAFVDNAADGLDQLADTIRERTFSEIYDDVEAFARRRPTAFAGAATLVGFMLARFLKASAENAEIRRQDARRQDAHRRSTAAGQGARPAGSATGAGAPRGGSAPGL